MEFDHVGYAVKDMTKARKAFEAIGFVFEHVIVDDARKIYICFGAKDSIRIELISPVSKGSPVDELLKKNGGCIPYHICFQVESIEIEAARLKMEGYKIIIPPAPACAFHGRRVVFLYHLSAGIIELVET